MKDEYRHLKPEEIERKSMEIIGEELGGRVFPPDEEPIIRRVIHTTADFDYADNLYFSPDAVRLAREALLSGADIVTDTNMAKAGINKALLSRLGGRVHCFMADEDVAAAAKERGITRASASMEKAAALGLSAVFAIGNAPTALMTLRELVMADRILPKLIIGVPVGFVNVIAAKEEIISMENIPVIVARGRKGGSNVAAAVCNALIYSLVSRE